MPRGDGTGPFGTGPIGRKSGGRGRGRGLRQNRACSDQQDKRDTSGSMLSGSLLKIPALILGIASLAVPALQKLQEVLEDRKTEKRLENADQDSKTITIKAEAVETVSDDAFSEK